MMKTFTFNHVVVQQLVFYLEFYVRTRACEKRESGNQPLLQVD